jgi:hypothetical protein
MERTELLGRVCGPLDPPDLNPRDFYLWGKLKSVVYANNSHDLEALKQNIHKAIDIKEFRHVSQQRTDMLNIFYDSEYNINYYS